jgi:hypothetical protein
MGQVIGHAAGSVTVPHIRGEDRCKTDQAAVNLFEGLSYFEEERRCAAGFVDRYRWRHSWPANKRAFTKQDWSDTAVRTITP